MTPTRRLWRKQSGVRDAAIEMFSMQALEPESVRVLFLMGVSIMGEPVRQRKAGTLESTATDQRVTVGSAVALRHWQQDQPSGGVAARNSLSIRRRFFASWPMEMRMP